ncbi:DUF4407 domain-containing protein [Nocardia camponoti]|uniref:Membrane protein n=1 Tax=Nocardia camponoti TaxID=1616106 RepID=A0A917QKG5_9NOCA|nr:DUF4407 domain-containing protein [Nocardia camponoti]GGK54993.1 membrane protein [Nocardia camponoti]
MTTGTGVLTWLGGGLVSPPEGLTSATEQSNYLVAGSAVALFAGTSTLVTGGALAAADGVGFVGVVAGGLLAGVATGALGRSLAAWRPVPRVESGDAVAPGRSAANLVGSGLDRLRSRDSLGALTRVAAAVGAGLVIGELASTVLLGGSVDQQLDIRAASAASSAPAVVTAQAELDAAVAARSGLDQTIAKSQADIDRALVIARCEFNPTPECPQTRITGVPGRGPEAQTANEMLDDSRKQLAAAQAKVDPADQLIRTETGQLAVARQAAIADADRGLGARWLALNDINPSLRLLIDALAVGLALLPLLLRRWRGQTTLDRRLAAAAVVDQAEREADIAIARKSAEVRTETAELQAEHELAVTRMAIEADRVIDRERQRTRIIAAIGGIELGITEPHRKDDSLSVQPNVNQLPAGYFPAALPQGAPSQTNALVPVAQQQQQPKAPAAPTGGGLELPIIGTVPFTDTAARWIRPLVPSFVANAIDTATHPLRTARQVFEEAEEVTFTLRRTRKVTVDSSDSGAAVPQQGVGQLPPGYAVPPGYYLPAGAQPYPGQPYQQPYAQPGYANQLAAEVVDAPGSTYHPDPRQYPGAPNYSALPAAPGNGLPSAHNDSALPGTSTSELGAGNQRQLPPAR